MFIKQILGHYIASKPVQISDQIGRQMVYEGSAIECAPPAPSTDPKAVAKNLRAMSKWEPKTPATSNTKLSKAQIAKLYHRELSYTHGKTKSVVR